MTEQEFFVRAITDYYGVAADELDLKEGGVYTVIQTTESGWWYAIDEDGIDGWVPSNYLDKVSDAEQAQLREEHRKQAEMEAQKQAELAAAGAYDVAPDEELDVFDDHGDDEKGTNASMKLELMKRANNFRARQELKSKANQGDQSAKKEFEELEKDRVALQKQKAATNQYKGRKDDIKKQKQGKATQLTNNQWKSDKEIKESKAKKELKWKKEREEKQAAARRPQMFEELSEEEMKKLDEYRPELSTVQINPNMHITDYSSKSYQTWSVDELLHYLTVNASSKNTFEVKSIVGYLGKKAQITEPIREDILSKNGLNILLNLLKCGGDRDVAVSMSCCKVIQILCESRVAFKYPAEPVGVFYLSTAIRNSFRNPIFCYTAFNSICNFTHNNDAHRDYVINDAYNNKIIGYIIEGMNKFRYSEDDVTRNHHCEKVQISACLALQNLAAKENGRVLIGNDGVEAVLDGFIAHVENNAVITAALGTLINLCANEENATHFIENDGLNYLLTYLQNPSADDNNKIKITICRILRNISLETATASTLCERDELDDVITSLLINADYATELFYEVVKFVNALITTLQSGGGGGFNKSLNQLMKNLSERNLFNILVDALEMDYDIDLEKNEYIMEINAQIAAIINSYILSPDNDVKEIIFSEADQYEPESFIPSKLIQAAFATPSPSLTYYTNSIFFNCMDATMNQLIIKRILIEVGILDYLLENTAWYQSPQVNDNAIALGMGIILCYLQVWYTDHQKQSVNNQLECDWDLNKYQKLIENFNQYIKQNKVNTTKSIQLKQTQPKLEQFCKAIPVLLRKYMN
eukprot:196860_1